MLITLVILLGCGAVQNLQDRLISEHPEWTDEEIELIRNKQIAVGMTEGMIRAAWGEPKYINETDSKYTGKVIAWSYFKLYSGVIKSVSFEDGKVTMFSDGNPKR